MKTLIAFLLIILGLSIHKIESVSSKKYGTKHDRGGFVFTAIISFFSMLFFLFMDIITDPNGLQFEKSLIYFGLVSGVSFASASMTMYWVLGHGPYGLCNLISSYSILITIGYGLIIGESLSIPSWIGVALICISLFLIMAGKQENKNQKIAISIGWLIVLVFSVLCSTAFGILQKHQQLEFSNKYDNEFMIITLGVSALLLFVAGAIKDGKYLKEVFRYGAVYAACGGLANGMTNALNLFVYTLVPISFVAPVKTGFGIIITFLIARLIFKEKYTARQYCGVALGCVALILFNF